MEPDLPFPPTPENAPRFAAFAVEAASKVDNEVLDYSPSSLRSVERVLKHHRGERRDANILLFGCYLGEVFVRAGRGSWRATEETPMRGMADVPLLVELPLGDYCNPLGRVRKFIDEGPSQGLLAFWTAFDATAKPAPSPWWRRLLRRRGKRTR